MKRVSMLILTAALGVGCNSLSGDWTGEMDCSEEAPAADIEFTLEKDEGNTYTGEGTWGDAGADCEVEFEIEVEAEKPAGEQDLEVTFDNCKIICGGESQDADCGEDLKAEWDGADEISWDDGGCEGDVERE